MMCCWDGRYCQLYVKRAKFEHVTLTPANVLFSERESLERGQLMRYTLHFSYQLITFSVFEGFNRKQIVGSGSQLICWMLVLNSISIVITLTSSEYMLKLPKKWVKKWWEHAPPGRTAICRWFLFACLSFVTCGTIQYKCPGYLSFLSWRRVLLKYIIWYLIWFDVSVVYSQRFCEHSARLSPTATDRKAGARVTHFQRARHILLCTLLLVMRRRELR